MKRNMFLVWIFAFYLSCTVYTVSAVYTDCERPPPILHGRSDLSVDDDGIIVTALYSCETSYRLHGESQLTCNTDTDEWYGDLPVCQLETGNNSSVSEIEQPEVIGTVAPELTHEEFVKPVEKSNDDLAASSQAPILDSETQQTTTTQNSQKKRRKKVKAHEFQEDNTIDVDFASALDLSCLEEEAQAPAPSVPDAFIVDYIRAKKEEYKFLVAVYSCDEDFYMENPQSNRLYCSQRTWVGNYPVCVFKDGDTDYPNELDEDDQNNDTNNTDDKNVAINIEEQNNDNINSQTDKKNETLTVSVSPTNNVDEQTVTNEVVHNEIPKTTTSDRCDQNNGGCEQICIMVPDEEIGINVPECSCNAGYYLDQLNGQNCFDVNECENPSICPNECENTIGSYRCVEETDVEIIPTTVNVLHSTEFNAPVKACGDGLHLDESNNCIDIDECAEGKTGCEYCQNIVGGYQCTCPDGFELNNDEKTCRDTNECTTYSEYDYDENTPTVKSICSHECVNTVGSFICRCPNNMHLGDDKRTCEQDFCKHLNDISANKTKCSHDCVDDVDGFHCKCPDGVKLDVDMKTCILSDVCSVSGDRCLPGICVNTDNESFKCECPTGFAEHNQRCVDYDECAIGTHQCSHKCMNIDGSYLCECPDGLILSNDQHTCVSTDICATNNGGCSDICNFVNENVICSCLDDAEIGSDGKTCQKKNICAENNGGCQQVCNVESNSCECFPGYETFDDGKICRDVNECLQNNGGCQQQCKNTDGGFDCTCFDGFMEDNTGNCVDKNECDLNNGNCDHECVNIQGSYQCICRPGYRLSDDQHHCFDTNECEINNGNCSDTCVNLQGSYQCTCPEGFKLDYDKVTCIEIKESCPALAAPEHGNVRCSRSRHTSKTFSRTICSFWCKDGFTLMGPSVKYCNGTDGIWDTTEITCVQSACPPLSVRKPGTMTDDCLNGKTYPGQSCTLMCPPGFKSTAPGITQCLTNRQWSTTDLRCEKIQNHPIQHPNQHPIQQPIQHTNQHQIQQPIQHTNQYQIQQPIQHPIQTNNQESLENQIQKQQQNNIQQGVKITRPKIQVQGGETHSIGHIDLNAPTHSNSILNTQTSIPTNPQTILRPSIKCPQDTVIILPKNEKLVHIKLEQPKTNVNWVTHVTANPKWAKNLQARLAAGRYLIEFTAHSPNSASFIETCRTVITVKPAIAPPMPTPFVGPKIVFCPQNNNVQLQPHELRRAIYWQEPTFRATAHPLKQIFKSHLPGTTFGVGKHQITYIATDIQNQKGTCQFTIIVHRPTVLAPYVSGTPGNALKDHTSYLLCKDRPAMELNTAFPVIPPGCYIKNIRNKTPLHYNPHHRRQAISSNNNFRYYSSWNQPKYFL